MKKRPKILLVDDDIGAMAYFVEALEREGYDVVQEWSVSGALDFLRAYSQTIDGAILDVMLPVGSFECKAPDEEALCGGLAVFRYLQSHHPGIPILILTNISSGSLLEHFPETESIRVMNKCDCLPSEAASIVRSLVGANP